jgi:hypothetical protein
MCKQWTTADAANFRKQEITQALIEISEKTMHNG